MFSKKQNIFNEALLKEFKIGDCVSYYQTLKAGEKIYAIITNICLEPIENNKERLVACAVLHTMHGKNLKIPLSLLNLEISIKSKQ